MENIKTFSNCKFPFTFELTFIANEKEFLAGNIINVFVASILQQKGREARGFPYRKSPIGGPHASRVLCRYIWTKWKR